MAKKLSISRPQHKKKARVEHYFQPGQSGNPGKEARDGKSLGALARSYCREAIETVRAIMLAAGTRPADRLHAAEILLDRGLGKPRQEMEVRVGPFDELDTAVLEAVIASVGALDAASGAAGEGADGSEGSAGKAPARAVPALH